MISIELSPTSAEVEIKDRYTFSVRFSFYTLGVVAVTAEWIGHVRKL